MRSGRTMKIRIWHHIGTWNLRTFLSISAGVHLLFLSGVALLFPDLKIDRLPPLNIEISLLPIVAQEKRVPVPLPAPQVKTPAKPEEKKPEPPLRSEPEMRPSPISAPLREDVKSEMRSHEEERTDQEPVVEAMTVPLNPEAAVPIHENKDLDVQNSTLPVPSPPREERREAKYSPVSDVEMVFIQPKYAENPKPLYPREAQRKGYQGEVVLKVEVLSNGQVGQIDVKRSSGHEILDRSALAAVKQWKFIPARKGENPVPFWVNIPVKFQLQ
jgi:protein TonB